MQLPALLLFPCLRIYLTVSFCLSADLKSFSARLWGLRLGPCWLTALKSQGAGFCHPQLYRRRSVMVAPPACFFCRAHCSTYFHLHSNLGHPKGLRCPLLYSAQAALHFVFRSSWACLQLFGMSAMYVCMHRLSVCPQRVLLGVGVVSVHLAA